MEINNVWLSLEEIAKRKYLSDVRLRQLVQNGSIYYKKVSPIDFLYEFSYFDTYFDSLINEEINEAPGDSAFFDLSHIDAILECIARTAVFNYEELFHQLFKINRNIKSLKDIIDVFNFIFQNNEYFEKLTHCIDYESIVSNNSWAQLLRNDDYFRGELFFIQYDDRAFPFDPEYLKEFFEGLEVEQKKIYLRFLMNNDKHLCFNNPFKKLPVKYYKPKSNKNEEITNDGKRAVQKVMINLKGLVRYLDNSQDVEGAIYNSKLNDLLEKATNKQWQYRPDFNLISGDNLNLDSSNELSFSIDIKIDVNLIWLPDMSSIIDNPDLIIQSINEIKNNTNTNILLFLPKSFLKLREFNKLRRFLETDVTTKAVIELDVEIPQGKGIAVLFTPTPNETFKPIYGELASWKVLAILIGKVLNEEQIPFYLKTEEKEWKPFKEQNQPPLKPKVAGKKRPKKATSSLEWTEKSSRAQNEIGLEASKATPTSTNE